MHHRFAALVAPLGLLLLVAAGEPPKDRPADPPKDPIVAQRGDLKLTADDVRAMLAKTDPATRAKVEATPSALATFVRDKMIDQTLLAEAKAKGWDQKPDVIQRINDARDSVILQTYAASLIPPDPNFPSEAAITATYDANKTRFMLPRQFHIAQIAILVPKDAKPEVEDAARKKAAELRAQAVKPKADFAALAKKNSQDAPTAEKGGDAGWVREDALVPAIREAIAGLAENAISDVVHLPDGYHVIRLLGIKEPTPAPLEEVRPQIVQALLQARNQQEIRNYINAMLKANPIQLNEIDLARQVRGTP
jgi:peptidylprolyl isomerase